MEKLGDYVKQSVLNFKLELCCFVASVRVGVLTLACLNIALGFITLITIAEGGFHPLLLQALNGMSDDPPDFVPICIVAYAVELASSVLLLCAMLRDDLVLLRGYLYYALGVLTAAVMVYSVVIGAVSIPLAFLIVASIAYQCYLILLVRSAMVEIKLTSKKNGYTVNLKQNVEAPSEPGPREKYSVVIETDVKKAPVSSLVKREPVNVVNKDTVAKAGLDKEVRTPLHLAAKQDITSRAGPAKDKEAIMPMHVVTKQVINNDEATKEVKKEKIKKPSRTFFGKKEKVQIEESKEKLEKIEETKKV